MADCLVMASHLIDTFVKTSRRRPVAEHLGFTINYVRYLKMLLYRVDFINIKSKLSYSYPS